MEGLMKEYIANRLSSSQLLIEKMANSESLIETSKDSTLVCIDAPKKEKKFFWLVMAARQQMRNIWQQSL
jgi:predicted nuclease with RNAse H fold